MKIMILDRIANQLKTMNQAVLYGVTDKHAFTVSSLRSAPGLERIGVFSSMEEILEENELVLSFSKAGPIQAFLDDEEHPVEIISYATDFNKRNKGLVDESVLQKLIVTIIGLGSGGASIALDLIRCGVTHLKSELKRLIRWLHELPTVGKWQAFIARFKGLLNKHYLRKDKSGTLSRRIVGELESLWLFLSEPGVEPTNNRAERALRYGVLWRKRSLGTQSEKGDHWAERIMSLRHTCRMHDIPVYPRLVQILSDYLNGQPTDLTWIANLA